MFTPSICNRLDRNTSGIIAAGKTMKGLQELSSHFKERTLTKYYICIVAGKVDKRQLIKGYLYKDKKLNKVTICQTLPKGRDTSEYLPIETEYIPVAYSDNATLLKVHLITRDEATRYVPTLQVSIIRWQVIISTEKLLLTEGSLTNTIVKASYYILMSLIYLIWISIYIRIFRIYF